MNFSPNISQFMQQGMPTNPSNPMQPMPEQAQPLTLAQLFGSPEMAAHMPQVQAQMPKNMKQIGFQLPPGMQQTKQAGQLMGQQPQELNPNDNAAYVAQSQRIMQAMRG